MTEKAFAVQADCKNPNCSEVLTVFDPANPNQKAEFSSQEEAVRTLTELLRQEQHQENKTTTHRLETCPRCQRMYLYSAKEMFIQMPRKKGKPWVRGIGQASIWLRLSS